LKGPAWFWAMTEIKLGAHSAIRNCIGSFPVFFLEWTNGQYGLPKANFAG
jgi:hypothetical protein